MGLIEVRPSTRHWRRRRAFWRVVSIGGARQLGPWQPTTRLAIAAALSAVGAAAAGRSEPP